MKLFLIRHGQTEWNRQKRYCSFTDVSLNETGREQGQILRKRLGKEKIHKIYSSDRKRTLQFARVVFKNRPIEKLAALREMSFGAFEGLTYHEIMDKYPKIYKKWLDNPLKITLPDGENLNNLAKRVREALAKVLSCNNTSNVAIFTHAGPIGIILCDILKLSLKEIWQIKPALASISVIEFTPPLQGAGFAKRKKRIHLLNDTSHLNG